MSIKSLIIVRVKSAYDLDAIAGLKSRIFFLTQLDFFDVDSYHIARKSTFELIHHIFPLQPPCSTNPYASVIVSVSSGQQRSYQWSSRS